MGSIDMHHHMLTNELVDALTSHGIHAAGGEPLPDWSPELSLTMMDRAGIETAVLSVPIPLHFLEAGDAAQMARRLNEYAVGLIDHWPGRFAYLATLPMPDVEAAVAEATRALDNGACGVAMLSNHAGVYQGDSSLQPLYEELDRRHAVAFIHPADPAVTNPLPDVQSSQLEFGFDATRAVANLMINQVPQRFPEIQFVFTHSGSCVPSVAHKLINRKPMVAAYMTHIREHGAPPPVDELLDQLSAAENAARDQIAGLYFDTALSTAEPVLDALTALVPTSHIVLGTDFPFGQEIGLRYTLRGIDRYPAFTDDDRAAVLQRNTQALLSWLS
jgi:6-methylsalicylate decarboxylase